MAGCETSVIAVVDDDDAVRESLAFLLTIAGPEVAAYASAADFLEQCDLCRVAGLILDHHMPKQTGLELLARLREDGRTLPVLLVTGSSSPEIVARAGALGVDRSAGETGDRRGPDGICRARRSLIAPRRRGQGRSEPHHPRRHGRANLRQNLPVRASRSRRDMERVIGFGN